MMSEEQWKNDKTAFQMYEGIGSLQIKGYINLSLKCKDQYAIGQD